METNEIRMDYIESELAKRAQREMPSSASGLGTDGLANGTNTTSEQSLSALAQREPAALGKLQEIDLGRENRLRNIARTKAATRGLAGRQGGASEDGSSAVDALGKDGKPWRNRKRRTSEDIERDRLVEEVLRESKRERPIFLLIYRQEKQKYKTELTLFVFQWMSTTSQRWRNRGMTELRTIESRSSFAESFLKQFTPAAALRGQDTRRQPSRRRNRTSPGVQSLEGAAALGPQCARCRRRLPANRLRRAALPALQRRVLNFCLGVTIISLPLMSDSWQCHRASERVFQSTSQIYFHGALLSLGQSVGGLSPNLKPLSRRRCQPETLDKTSPSHTTAILREL